MNADQIKLLMETMAETGLTSLKLEQDGFKLRLEKTAPAVTYVNQETSAGQPVNNTNNGMTGTAGAVTGQPSADNQNALAGAASVVSGTAAASGSNDSSGSSGSSKMFSPLSTAEEQRAKDTAADHPEEKPGKLIKSPVVGIYYASPSPDSDPFVTVGSTVKKGETVCIIEAMKLMNEITSDYAGTVLEICVENGQRIEFGQPLMRIGV